MEKELKLSNIEAVHKIYEKIKALDKEIIQIEKLALSAVNNDRTATIEIRFENTENESELRLIKAMGYRGPNIIFSPRGFFEIDRDDIPEEKTKMFSSSNFQLSELDCLKLYSVILQSKIRERENLLKALSHLGVTV